MPILKEKPILKPKPPCNGCDFCDDCREDGLYLLGYNDKYYCHDCFSKKAQNWPKSKPSSANVDVFGLQV